MKVVGRADLSGRELERHQVEVGGGLNAQSRRYFHIARKSEGLRIFVLYQQLIVGILVALAVVELVVDIQRPGGIGIGVVEISTGDVLSRNRVIINSLVAVCR